MGVGNKRPKMGVVIAENAMSKQAYVYNETSKQPVELCLSLSLSFITSNMNS